MADPSEGRGAAAGATPRASKIAADLPARAAAAVVMAALAIGAAWNGGFVFLIFWLAAALVVLWEWQRLADAGRMIERVALGALALIAAAPFALHGGIVGSLGALALGAIAVGRLSPPPIRAFAATGVVYAGALVVAPTLLRGSPTYGLAAVLWLFAVVWGADVMAYFGGRLIGGPKLWPRVSPGKTWSGAVVGAICGAALGLLLGGYATNLAALFGLGLVAAFVSQLGDLFESALKRRFGVKDSSGLIPGHGGLMDRLDAFVAAAVFAAVLAGARAQGDWIASGLFKW